MYACEWRDYGESIQCLARSECSCESVPKFVVRGEKHFVEGFVEVFFLVSEVSGDEQMFDSCDCFQ